MRWQIKLQNRRTLEVDPEPLREFTDYDIRLKGSDSDFRSMVNEINADLSEETKQQKMLLVCDESDENFTHTYVKDVEDE